MIAWIDLETTGLSLNCGILEVACIITDTDYNELGWFTRLVKPDIGCKIEPVAKQMHVDSGLWDEAFDKGKYVHNVDGELMKFLHSFVQDSFILGGQSVHFDRGFVEKYMPGANKFLSHRQIDVSGMKLFCSWGFSFGVDTSKLPPIKSLTTHRALDDIKASIDGMRWYRDNLILRHESPDTSHERTRGRK